MFDALLTQKVVISVYFDHIKEKAGVILMKVRIMISNMEKATLSQVRHCGISVWVYPM